MYSHVHSDRDIPLITERIKFGLTALLIALALSFSGKAYAHVEEGHMPDSVAEVEYKILLEFKPNNIEVRTKLAFVLIRQGKLDEAERELEKAAKKAADDPRVHEGFIVLRLKQKKLEEALELAKKAVQSSPDMPILYLHYGNVLEAQDEPTEALKLYRTGLGKIHGKKNDHDREQLEEALKKLGTGQKQPTVNP